MKLASFRVHGRDRIGFEASAGKIVEIGEALRVSGVDLPGEPPTDMSGVIHAGTRILEALGRAHEFVTQHPDKVTTFDADEVSWHAPIPAPSKIVCLALNNRALDAIKLRAPTDHPAFFLKPSTAVTGHRGAIRLRESYGLTHPEPELGVVIGRKLSVASPETAMEGVFGYTIVNDITSVGMREEDSFSVRYYKPGATPGEMTVGEAHTTYPGRYKASDTFAPMGPYLVTRDEVPDPAALKIECRLGEKLVASDHTRNYVWGVADALSHISRTMTLLPGDVVSMGTAVGAEPPEQAAQKIPSITRVNLVGFDGNVGVTISRLGTLINSIEMI